jgi:CBS domain-containing protein
MTNRPLTYVIRNREPLVLSGDATVREACRAMLECSCGSVLIVDDRRRVKGIFTGRDAVRLLATGKGDPDTPLAKAGTRKPSTMAADGRAVDALRLMLQGGFRHVPVVSEDGELIGVVSRGDLKGMEIEEYRWHSHGRLHGLPIHSDLAEIVASQKPIVMAGTATVGEACAALCRERAGAVLVVDSRERLKGIFTGRDAARALVDAKAPAELRLSRAMTRDPVTLGPECRPIEALRAMCEGGFRHVPVVDGGRILGVVSRSDFTGVELDRLEEEEHLKECIW